MIDAVHQLVKNRSGSFCIGHRLTFASVGCVSDAAIAFRSWLVADKFLFWACGLCASLWWNCYGGVFVADCGVYFVKESDVFWFCCGMWKVLVKLPISWFVPNCNSIVFAAWLYGSGGYGAGVWQQADFGRYLNCWLWGYHHHYLLSQELPADGPESSWEGGWFWVHGESAAQLVEMLDFSPGEHICQDIFLPVVMLCHHVYLKFHAG